MICCLDSITDTTFKIDTVEWWMEYNHVWIQDWRTFSHRSNNNSTYQSDLNQERGQDLGYDSIDDDDT